jgi:hypothetical protein
MQGIILAAMLSGAAAAAAPQSADDLRYEKIEPSPKQMAKLQALTPEGVAAGVEIHDDDLETVATITTVKAYQSNGAFTDRVRSDNFLRAFVDKRTGEVRYQLYQSVSYNYVYRNFTGVNYASSDGPRTAPVTVIDHEVVACMGGADHCSYKDTIGFDVSEAQLRWVAGQYVAGNSPFWRFKFRSQAGMDWEDRIAPAEAAGVLEAVRRYLAKHGVSGTTHQ